MTVYNGRTGRSQTRVLRRLRPVLLLTFVLGSVLPASAGPIRWVRTDSGWTRTRVQPNFAPRIRPLSRTSLPATSANAPGGPFAGYFRWALRNRMLRVNVPPMLRNLEPMSDGRLPNWAFVDYLTWRRSLNPARFDQNHPNLAAMLVFRPTDPPVLPPIPDVPTDPLRPLGQKPLPPQVPEPSSALIAATLLGAGLWARRRRSRLQDPAGGSDGAIGGNSSSS